ncbi:MAG: BrnT family toxin [Acidobacteria bacterium]|nr:BrnT family toxin [Acidobacteriota bacterium]MBI3658809.1 BrnT family toxin [Acidobacteriota bacterium]
MRFEWDPHKAEINLKRHRVSFDEAVEAFVDPNSVDDHDAEHAGYEARYNLIGLSSRRLLFIVYTEPEGDAIRIISARKAEKKHRRIYEHQS